MSEIFGKPPARPAASQAISRALRAKPPGAPSRRAVLASVSAGALGTLAAPIGGLAPAATPERFVIVDGWVLSEDDIAPPRRR